MPVISLGGREGGEGGREGGRDDEMNFRRNASFLIKKKVAVLAETGAWVDDLQQTATVYPPPGL